MFIDVYIQYRCSIWYGKWSERRYAKLLTVVILEGWGWVTFPFLSLAFYVAYIFNKNVCIIFFLQFFLKKDRTIFTDT